MMTIRRSAGNATAAPHSGAWPATQTLTTGPRFTWTWPVMVQDGLPEEVVLRVAGGEERLPNDYVFVFAGGEPPFPLLRGMGVELGGGGGAQPDRGGPGVGRVLLVVNKLDKLPDETAQQRILPPGYPRTVDLRRWRWWPCRRW